VKTKLVVAMIAGSLAVPSVGWAQATGYEPPPASEDFGSATHEFYQAWGLTFRAMRNDSVSWQDQLNRGLAALRPAYNSANAWNGRNCVTPVDEQLDCNSCWAFGATAVMESAYCMGGEPQFNGSEQALLECRPAISNSAQRCGRSSYFQNAFNMLRYPGLDIEANQPYTPGLYASCGISTPNTIKRYGIDSAYFLPPVNPAGKNCQPFTNDCSPPAVADIKKAIVEHGAVSLWLKITQPFRTYDGRTPIKNTANDVAAARDQHGVAIVGWDDTKAAWRFKNSWGTESTWGSRDGGFGWIAYNDPSLSRRGYAVVTPQDKPWTLSEQQVAMIRWVARLALKPVIWRENPRVSWPVSLGFPREPITVVDGVRDAIRRALIPPTALDQLPGFPRG
jgi:hypothetical protein